MKPTYAENIVVAIKSDHCLEWYVLDKELCFLDSVKLDDIARQKGYEVFEDDTYRFGIKIVNEQTKEPFLDAIKAYKVTAVELKNMLMDEKDYDEKLAYNPSILIDFDHKFLISHYAEPESFEYYVPDGWEGTYRDFTDCVPQEQRYWQDENGQSMIGRGQS